MSDRPQNKNLIPMNQRTMEERKAIGSKGGKVCAERRAQKKAAAEMMQMFCDLPVVDGRTKNRLKRLGIESDDMTNKMQMIVAIGKLAQAGNVYAFDKVLELLGEGGMSAASKENNLIEALLNVAAGKVNTDDIPELQHAAKPDADVVDQGTV